MSEQKPLRDNTAGIGALCSAVVFIILLIWILMKEDLNSEFPVEIFILVPFLGVANLLGIVALCWPGTANKRLGLFSLTLVWGACGAAYVVP